MSEPTDEFVIFGLTLDGSPFRPSDWADRLCGVMAQFGGGAPHRIAYSPYVYPILTDGVRAVVVDSRLREIEPLAYKFLMNFAKDNELRVRSGRNELREGAPAPATSTAKADQAIALIRAASRLLFRAAVFL